MLELHLLGYEQLNDYHKMIHDYKIAVINLFQ